jgi:hypothetical protein
MKHTRSLVCVALAASIAPVWAQGSAPVAKAPSALAKKNLSLRDWARTQQARQAYGLYALGRKVGWMTMDFRVEKRNGRDVVAQSSQAQMRVRAVGGPPDLAFSSETLHSLEGSGPMLLSTQRSLENGQPTTHKLSSRGSGASKRWVLETNSAGKTIARKAEAPREDIRQSRRMMEWLATNPPNGATFPYYSTSIDEANMNRLEKVIFRGRKSMAWGGVPITVYAVRMTSRGSSFDADVRPNGLPVTGRVGGLIEMRAEEDKVAKNLDSAGVDLLEASLIKVDKRLGDPRRLDALTLEASNMSGFSLPQSPRQKVARRNGVPVISLRREAPGNLPQVLAPASRRNFLASTPSVQSDEASVRALARRLTSGTRDPLKKGEALVRYVYGALEKSMESNSSTALQVLATKKGDCTEHALLFVTLARAAGIPAREVTGLAYVETPDPTFGWHAWAEIHNGREWVSMDPTWNEVRVDASHIKFSDDPDDYSWTNALGKLQLKVLDFKSS